MALWNKQESKQLWPGLRSRNKTSQNGKSQQGQRQLRFETLESRRVLSATNLLITEFMAANDKSLLDGDDNSSDWIEIHNPSNSAVNLVDYYLTDNQNQPQKWSFPSTIIEPGDYFVVFASAPGDGSGGTLNNYVDPLGNLHTNFKLSSDGEYLGLSYKDPSSQVTSTIYEFSPSYPQQETDISYGISQDKVTLVETGVPVSYHVPTDGSLSTTWTGTGFDDSNWTNKTSTIASTVVITELNVGLPDWIEIQNVSDQTIETAGWRVAFNNPINGQGINSIHSFLWNFADPLSANQVMSVDDSSSSIGNINWSNSGPGWALLIDNVGEVRDFVVWGYSQAEIASFDTTINNVALTAADLPWTGDAITGNSSSRQTLQRSGNSDSNTAGDFAFGSSDSQGSSNSGMTLPFPTTSFKPTTLGIGYDVNPSSGPSFELLNLAPAGTTSQSSTASGGVGDAAVNGDYGDFTHTASGDNLPSYWQVDLGESFVLEEVTLFNRTSCCGSRLRDITVEIFDTDQNVVFTSTLLNPENALNSPNQLELDLVALNSGSPVIGRTVRVTRTPDPDLSGTGGQGNNDEADVLSLAEVEVMGRELLSYKQIYQTDIQNDLHNQNSSVYLRTVFDVIDDPTIWSQLLLNIQYDDGFVAYLNGAEIASRNAPASLSFNSTATTDREKTAAIVAEEIDISAYLHLLQQGENTLAIHGLNTSAGDGDFLIAPELIGISTSNSFRYFGSPTPGSPNNTGLLGFVADTQFSVDRGFFDTGFSLDITTATPDAVIYYTTNGDVPTPANGTLYSGSLNIDKTTTLRAAAFKLGYFSTNTDTQTYLFTRDIVSQDVQASLDAGFPASWGSRSADYGLDPDVIGNFDADGNPTGGDDYNGVYADAFQDALKSIPTLSIVLDTDDVFGSNGIYTNSNSHGKAYERATSAEWITDDESLNFQIDAGLRIQGGAFRSDGLTKKHSFRLLFKSEYGAKKLDFPLFGEGAADEFNTIVLRAGANDGYSWNAAKDTEQYIRDEFGRSLQLASGNPGSHGDFVHLYINGIYWGLYNPVERPDNEFGETYVSGDADNWDAIHVSETPSGDSDAWEAMFSLTEQAGSSQTAFMQLQGKNLDGTPHATEAPLLDVQNYVDYIALNVWGGNWDWPWKNYWAGRDRSGETTTGFQFFTWDFENTMGNNRDRSPLDAKTLDQDFTGGRNAGQPHTNLKSNTEYRMLFADHVHKMFFNDGILTPENLRERYQQLADQVEQAMIGESARWGDQHFSTPLTLADWQAERDWILNTYLTQRSDIVLQELRSYDLYPNTNAPVYNQHGGQVASGFDLTMSSPTGTIYYTLDGSDPRVTGGGVSPTALIYTGSIDVATAMTVRARALSGGEWSALNSADFIVASPATVTNLRITEVNYNPHDANPVPGLNELAVDSDEFEFVELQNISGMTIDLTDVQFVEVPVGDNNEGIVFTFGQQTLAPGERVLIVNNQAAFESRYGFGKNIAGEYAGKLSNSGEQLTVKAADGETIQTFGYNDGGDWPGRADGTGSSLEVVNTAGDFDIADNWRSSNEFGGTPGIDGTGPTHDIIVNEILSHSEGDSLDMIELYNTTATPIDLNKWYLSDGKNNLYQFQFAVSTSLGGNQYLVLDQNQLGFALDGKHGDDVWLIEADASDKPLRFADHVEFDATDTDVSLGRWTSGDPNGPLFPMTSLTLGGVNTGPVVADVVISEIHYNTVEVPLNEAENINKNELEFLEIVNVSGSARDISNWKTTGIKFTFPASTTLAINEALLIVTFDPELEPTKATAFRNIHNIGAGPRLFGSASESLSNAGEQVKLLRPEDPVSLLTGDVLVDAVRYDNESPWPATAAGDSLHRSSENDFGNFETSWSVDSSTPGSATLTAPVSGDFDGDNDVDGADFLAWQRGFGKTGNAAPADGDANGDNNVDAFDLGIWANQFGRTNLPVAATISFSVVSYPTASTPTSADLQVDVTNNDSVSIAFSPIALSSVDPSSIATLYANSRQAIDNNARDTVLEEPIFLFLISEVPASSQGPNAPTNSSNPTDEALATFGDEITEVVVEEVVVGNDDEFWFAWN